MEGFAKSSGVREAKKTVYLKQNRIVRSGQALRQESLSSIRHARSHIPSNALLQQVSGNCHIYMHHTDNALEML